MPDKRTCPARKWTKRAGVVAFIFFLGKGLVWLGVAAAGAYYALN
ncbi:MAG: alanyl-tRNA synthetase [Pyrinomonadaceae bacterium]